MATNAGYSLGKPAMDRIKAAVQWVEGSRRGEQSKELKNPPLWNYACVDAIAQGTITAGNSTVYGAGTVRILTFDASTNSLSKIVDDTFGVNSDGIVSVYNPCNASYTNGATMVISWRNGGWLVVTGSCNG